MFVVTFMILMLHFALPHPSRAMPYCMYICFPPTPLRPISILNSTRCSTCPTFSLRLLILSAKSKQTIHILLHLRASIFQFHWLRKRAIRNNNPIWFFWSYWTYGRINKPRQNIEPAFNAYRNTIYPSITEPLRRAVSLCGTVILHNTTIDLCTS